LGINQSMRMTSTVATEVHLGLPPLHLQLEAEAKAGIYRLDCNNRWKPKSEGFGHACMTPNMESEPIPWIGTDVIILR
jgi:hypothetical protein